MMHETADHAIEFEKNQQNSEYIRENIFIRIESSAFFIISIGVHSCHS